MAAWYEMQGPIASDVRKDVLNEINIIHTRKDKYQKEKDKIIQDTLIKIIPDNRNDFGSWRGYNTFGLKKQLAKEVIKEVRKGYALLTLKKQFIPFIIYHLYNPENGLMMKKKTKTTLIGKNPISL